MGEWVGLFIVPNVMFLRRVGQAQFERRPTIVKRREIMVGRRGEAPLVPPYSLRSPNKAMVRCRLWWAMPTLRFSAMQSINFRRHTARQEQITLDLDQFLKQGASHGADC